MLDKVTESDNIQYLKFHNLVPGYYESLCHNWEEKKEKHNALWNILTGVKLITAGAAAQMSVSFPALVFHWLKSKWLGKTLLPGVLLRL